MMIIDAHQHFWNYSLQKQPWITDRMRVLKSDFLPQDLLNIYKENTVEGCVAVQADPSEEETDFLLRLAEAHDFIKGVVGWVDLQDDKLEARLDHYKGFQKLKGFRHLVQDEPDPDFMLYESFRKGLSLLEKHGYSYDLLVHPHQLKAAIQTARDFPNLKLVLDHMAKPDIKNRQIDNWREDIEALASENNVFCKISGMVTEASWESWQQGDFIPYLDIVFRSFGIDRVMFGSDWPVCLMAGSYAQVLNIVKEYVRDFSEEGKHRLFCANASRFYGLSQS